MSVRGFPASGTPQPDFGMRRPRPGDQIRTRADPNATWTAARQNVFSPGGSRRDVDRSRCLGLPAESVCGRVGLVVAPESGAYTVACIDPLTFQEELQYYIAVKD